MEKSYSPRQFEASWYAHWEGSGYFSPSGHGKPYSIMLPPPNVTGTLHMGHAFQHTLMDTLARYHRMCGFDTLWQLGTDHAGIATEMVVTRQLLADGYHRSDLSSAEFIDRVWDWKNKSGGTISQQMRRLGVSGDWSRERFTMDKGFAQAVTETFVSLFRKGMIERRKGLVNWDPTLKTAISDLEVVTEEEEGFLWSIRYPFADGSGEVTVATTRPETIFGDVAVAVHPDDERYREHVGKELLLPLSDRKIRVIADTYVDPLFGTGAVKITPAHDFNDYAVGQRHGLPIINVLDDAANLNDCVPPKYRGMNRVRARAEVLADLETSGALLRAQKHKMQIPRGDRSGDVIEPYLTSQWFLRMDGLAKRGLELVESGKVRFVPPNWVNTYRHWMTNIHDWCISRQLTWGHRIPAWFSPDGSIFVAHSEAEAQAAATEAGIEGELIQDRDVLETWFSASMWCHASLGWPDSRSMSQLGFDRYLPSTVLVTGFDIIFFWVARMIMMTDHFTGIVPFHDVYITGLVRDKNGRKMSKSKGNVIDPLDLIDGIDVGELVRKRTYGLMQPKMAEQIARDTVEEFPNGIPEFGADALRLTFASLATQGRDVKFDLDRCAGYRAFLNKLWNSARFVLMNIESAAPVPRCDVATETERWILTRLNKAIAEVRSHISSYRFDLALQSLYQFTWDEFCDWFVELSKVAFKSDSRQVVESTKGTLVLVLDNLLRALHPFAPFVTEEIWQQLRKYLDADCASIMISRYPEPAEIMVDVAAESEVDWMRNVLIGVRRIRAEMNLPQSKRVSLMFADGDARDRKLAAKFAAQISALGRTAEPEWLNPQDRAPASSAIAVGNMRVLIPLMGALDVDAELARLEKEIAKIEANVGRSQTKLNDPQFISNAPMDVVALERQRIDEWRGTLDTLREQIKILNGPTDLVTE